ncbi:PDZ domain-containing protein [Nocardioides sp. KIGAM211]|uniref:endopeptidase La n=1 Tax=Nocardioides luti TaxID=2761101 RepID=A0A7X0RL66_9ACTN|nr:PDZ domain-containing protein [Nocardioides luti]MBB6629119.1 PDZ domain-containing protein [Nocardioides luti]
MTQRTLAGLLAVPLLAALWILAATRPLPFVTYEPGLTVDVLASTDGDEIIQVGDGQKTYRDDGQLRMTTVYVSQPTAHVNIFELMHDWISDEDAVYPYSAVYQKGETTEQNQQQGAVEMVSSQDAAIAVALDELGYDVKPALEVLSVVDGAPADGKLKVRDILQEVDGAKIASTDDLTKAIDGATGEITLGVLRNGKPTTVRVTPGADGKIGIQFGLGYVFPFPVSVNIDPSIGGPSAGLMFSLGIYDTLTPGSLTGGATVAGTGTIDGDGKVGPIGGIQQKIAGARNAGAQLFMVPPDNCADAVGAANGDMRLVKATTMHDAVEAIKAWVKDHDATLPSCEGTS